MLPLNGPEGPQKTSDSASGCTKTAILSQSTLSQLPTTVNWSLADHQVKVNVEAVLEIECIPKLVIIVSDCIPSFRSVCPMCIPTFKCVYHMCIPTFSSFIVLRAQFPSPSFPCGSSPDTMKQLSLKPHLTAPSAKDDDSSSSSGSPAPFFMGCMYHMCIPGF